MAVPVSPRAHQVLRDFFVYTFNVPSIAPAANVTGAISIEADSDFELQKLSCFADVAGGAQTDSTRVLALVTLQITDQGSGRQLFSAPTPIPAVMGHGEMPFILPTSKLFRARSALSFTLSNYASATTYGLRLSLIGSKIFRFGES